MVGPIPHLEELFLFVEDDTAAKQVGTAVGPDGRFLPGPVGDDHGVAGVTNGVVKPASDALLLVDHVVVQEQLLR